MLKEQQKFLNLCQEKLVINVVNHWNSDLEMLLHFLEQQPAITDKYTITKIALLVFVSLTVTYYIYKRAI